MSPPAGRARAPAPERADAIVVGARCAGSAAATALAEAGRRVVVLDRSGFPSDTLSTHLFFAGGLAELAAIGALERVEAIGAPRLPVASMSGAGLTITARYTPVRGIDYGMCVRRSGLDAALVETAREAGADVRERAAVRELVRVDGRVAGVRYSDADGAERPLLAPLVVGADGRRSTVARLTGATVPRRSNRNQRACYFAYFEDGRAESRGIAAQWREGAELGTAFPCDDGLVLVLLMPPLERAEEFREGLDRAFSRTIARMPGLRERLEGCRRASKVRSALDTTSYFRSSSGPGWALAGDSGHFKDPITAQGMRDALRFGRLLGEAAAPVLDDRLSLDAALARWERRRDRECLESYQWTNRLARAEPMSPIEVELYRAGAQSPDLARDMLDVFSRSRLPSEALPARRAAVMVARALARPGADRAATARLAARELRAALADRVELRRAQRTTA